MSYGWVWDKHPTTGSKRDIRKEYRMNLKDYYKTHIYDYAYNNGYNDKSADSQNHIHSSEDIYFNDEMDYYICADYYGCFVGSVDDWTDEDIKLLNVLGFTPEDFEEN